MVMRVRMTTDYIDQQLKRAFGGFSMAFGKGFTSVYPLGASIVGLNGPIETVLEGKGTDVDHALSDLWGKMAALPSDQAIAATDPETQSPRFYKLLADQLITVKDPSGKIAALPMKSDSPLRRKPLFIPRFGH